MKRHVHLLTAFQIILLILWLLSGLDKVYHFNSFKAALLAQPFPDFAAMILAYLLPISELLTASLLAFQRYTSTALRISTILMTAYTNYIGMAIFLGANTYICKCNLLIEKLDWNIHLLFNILFLFISFSAAVIKRSQHRSDGSGRATAEGTSAKRLYS